jgi:beta-glucosidase
MYPRGYSVQTSLDGKSWSKPVATGKGDGPRTTITFPATRAKFVRITQTDSVADAPGWSIRNLRVFEARAAK